MALIGKAMEQGKEVGKQARESGASVWQGMGKHGDKVKNVQTKMTGIEYWEIEGKSGSKVADERWHRRCGDKSQSPGEQREKLTGKRGRG